MDDAVLWLFLGMILGFIAGVLAVPKVDRSDLEEREEYFRCVATEYFEEIIVLRQRLSEIEGDCPWLKQE